MKTIKASVVELTVRRLSLMVLLLLVAQAAQAQKARSLPLEAVVFNQGVTIPFTRMLTTPFHPGFQFGTEFGYKQNVRSRFFQAFHLGYYYHRHLAHGLFLTTHFGYEYRTRFGLSAGVRVGAGYLHTFTPGTEYRLENGEYQAAPDRGNARLMPSLSLDVGYYLSPKPGASRVFVRYQPWMQYPFSPG